MVAGSGDLEVRNLNPDDFDKLSVIDRKVEEKSLQLREKPDTTNPMRQKPDTMNPADKPRIRTWLIGANVLVVVVLLTVVFVRRWRCHNPSSLV